MSEDSLGQREWKSSGSSEANRGLVGGRTQREEFCEDAPSRVSREMVEAVKDRQQRCSDVHFALLQSALRIGLSSLYESKRTMKNSRKNWAAQRVISSESSNKRSAMRCCFPSWRVQMLLPQGVSLPSSSSYLLHDPFLQKQRTQDNGLSPNIDSVVS